MVKYFRYFPRRTYKGVDLVDISKRANIVEALKNNSYAFMPYTIEGDDRPEDISFLYYGDVAYTWTIYLANGIVDPYNEWPKKEREFDDYIISKYAEQSGETGRAVLEWSQNQTITDNIVYYFNKNDPTDIITTDTYDLGDSIDGFDADDWLPMRVYEKELEDDNAKRKIYLVNRLYIDQVSEDLRDILDDS